MRFGDRTGNAVTICPLYIGSTEGEFVPGTPAQSYYYGPDQISSVRRVFASTSSAPAYGYDPYGNALQATAPLTDFGYAGRFTNADSGLYLTQFRAYDPVAGRWLSRDPIGEAIRSEVSVADGRVTVQVNPGDAAPAVHEKSKQVLTHPAHAKPGRRVDGSKILEAGAAGASCTDCADDG